MKGYWVGAAAFLALGMWACKPRETPQPVAYGIFEINVRPSFNGTALQTGVYYSFDSFRVRIDTLQILTTGPKLDGGASHYDRPFLFFFTSQANKTTHGAGVFYVFETEAKKYAGARVRCGLPDGVSDRARPSDFARDHPLGVSTGLFEGEKYVHLKVTGQTVANGDTLPFRWLLTQNPFEWIYPQAFEVRKGRETQWIFEPEMSLLFFKFSPRSRPQIGDSTSKFVSAFLASTYSYLNEY